MKQNAPPALFHVLFQGALEASELFILVLLANKLRQTMTDIQIYAELCAISSGDVFSWLFSPSLSVSVVSQHLLTDYFLFFSHISSLKENRLSTGFFSGEKKRDICVFTQRLCNSSANVSAGTRRPQLRNEIEIVFRDILSCQEWDEEKWRPQLP